MHQPEELCTVLCFKSAFICQVHNMLKSSIKKIIQNHTNINVILSAGNKEYIKWHRQL